MTPSISFINKNNILFFPILFSMMSLQVIYTMDNLLTTNILTTSQYTWKIFEI